jgi:AcrR family transcriptional regulator
METIFDVPAALPHGPHGLSRQEVSDSQRTRLYAAIADVVAERGFAEATIAEIARRAGVSPKTFYVHFDDKLDCMLAAYDAFAAVLLIRMGSRLEPRASWSEFIDSTLETYLGTLEGDPSVARAFLVEIDAAGPRARERRRAAYEQFASLIADRHAEIRRREPALGPIPDRVYLGIVHGIRQLVCDALERKSRPRLRALKPDLRFLIEATVRGAAAAQPPAKL